MDFLLISLALALCVHEIEGHAFMSDPPGRSSAWRYGFPTKINHDDDSMGCGHVRYEECGVCGDPLHQNPGANQLGGKYGTGLIVATYYAGSRILTKTKVTTNHYGWFEWSICRLNGNQPATEDCFQPLISLDVNRRPTGFPHPERKWELRKSDGLGEFDAEIQLPKGFVCEHCVLRWFWNGGNDWGCDENGGLCGMGRGPTQEKFWTCADIAILPNGNPPQKSTTTTTTTTTTTGAPVVSINKSKAITTKKDICAGAKMGEIRSHPDNCCSYVYCLWMGTVWEHVAEKKCPPGLAFNDKDNTCESILKVDCGKRSTVCSRK